MVGGRVVFSKTDRTLLLKKIYAEMCFEKDVRLLKTHGIALPQEAFAVWTGRYRVERVRLKDLHPMLPWLDHELPTLEESPLVRFLHDGQMRHLEEFAREMAKCGYGWRMEDVEVNSKNEKRSLEQLSGIAYDPSVSCITIDERGLIIDGQHRAASLFAAQGGETEVLVVRAFTNPPCLRLCRYGK